MGLFFKGRSAGVGRSTLRALLELDDRRLNDLGLTRFDLVEALRRGRFQAAEMLDARRNERAANWLR